MSKGSSNTVTDSTSSTTPNPAAMAAYESLLNRAQSVSNTPYQAYTGEETAPINAQQQAGFGNINAGVAGFDPNQAWSDIGQGTQAVSGNDINQYMDPYTNDVVNATQADFDTQNQRANSIVTGNAASQDALGGNRVGVAQALTQEGQERVQAPQIAALRSAGFQSAEQMANTQKARELQGGQTAEQLGMAGASAQVGAGNIQQQTQQTGDTQQMQDYFRSQGYDFQTASWLASLVLPTGSQMGTYSNGTSATQGPQPNQYAQAAGLGLTAASMFIKDGGRIPGFAGGGAPYSGGVGWVPDVGGSIHGTPLQAAAFPQHANMSKSQPDYSKMGAGLGKIGKGLSDKYQDSTWKDRQGNSGLATDEANNGSGMYTGPAWQAGFGDDAYAGTASDPLPGLDASDYGMRRGGGVRRGFESGGVPISTGFGGGSYDDDLSPNDAVNERFANPYLGSDQYKNYGADSKSLVAEGLARHPDIAVAENTPRSVKTLSYVPTPELKPSGVAQGDIVPKAMQAFKGIQSGVAPPSALGFADDESPEGTSDATDFSARRRTAGVAAPLTDDTSQQRKGLFGLNISDEARQGLISMGLGMMANRQGGKGSFLAAVGQGGEQGMQTYASAKAATAAQEALKRKERLEREKLEETKKQHGQTLEEQKRHRQYLEMQPVKVGVDALGQDILGIKDPKTGQFKSPLTGKPIELPAGITTPSPNTPTSKAAPNPDDEASLPPGAKPTAGHAEGTNPEVLESLPPEMANKVLGIAEGRQSLQTVPMRQRTAVQNLVNAYDPSFDQSSWTARNAMQRDMAVGNTGKLILASNQLLPHLKTASDKAAELNNSGYPAANTIANWWITATGDPRVKEFDTVRTVAATDAARLLRGSGAMAHEEIRGWEERLKNAGSPAQLQGVLALLGDDLIGARMSSIEHQYRMVMRKDPPELMSKDAKDALAVLRSRNPSNAKVAVPSGSIPGVKDGAKVWKTPDGQYIPRAE